MTGQSSSLGPFLRPIRSNRSPAYTSKLIREDKLVLRDGQIDVQASDARLNQTRLGLRSASEEHRASESAAKERLSDICGRLIHWVAIANLMASCDGDLNESEAWLRQGIENCMIELDRNGN